jgi:hypothetical protein
VLGNSRRPLVVCDQCNRTDPANSLYSARTNSESQQPVRCAASPTGSGFAGFGIFSRIIPRGYQSSGQSSAERFSRAAQAAASCPHRPLSRIVASPFPGPTRCHCSRAAIPLPTVRPALIAIPKSARHSNSRFAAKRRPPRTNKSNGELSLELFWYRRVLQLHIVRQPIFERRIGLTNDKRRQITASHLGDTEAVGADKVGGQ